MAAFDNERLRAQLQEQGFCILPNVLSREETVTLRQALVAAADLTRRLGFSTHSEGLDPNARNVRVFNLPALDVRFMELLRHPVALQCAEAVLGAHFLVSNLTANIALPGSGSMRLHSDQALVVPSPWHHPWAMNVIWCLDDVNERNGATRYLPDSHRYLDFDATSIDISRHTLPFEAPAGSVIAMEGRLWHTSGQNVTENEERAMLFTYYSSDFIRQQMNWEAVLPEPMKSGLDPELHRLLGLGAPANLRMGEQYTRLSPSGNSV